MEDKFNFEVCNQSTTLLCKKQIDNLSANLPLNYAYCICGDFEERDENNFLVSLAVNTRTEDEAKEWLKQFQLKSKTTMRVDRTFHSTGHKNLFKKQYRCQHKTRSLVTGNEKQSCKNTNCPAYIALTVRRSDRNRGKNVEHIQKFPTMLRLGFLHNHPIMCAEALRHRDVSVETETKFKQLFANGHNPASALAAHKHDLHMEYAEDYEQIASDRAVLPDLNWCYRLYYKTVKPLDRVKRKYFNTNVPKQVIQKQEPSLPAVQEDIKEFCKALDDLKNKITAKMQTEAVHEFRPAVQSFVGSVRNIKSDSVLISALTNFGKYPTGILQRKRTLSELMDEVTKKRKLSNVDVGSQEITVEVIELAEFKQMFQPLKTSHLSDHNYTPSHMGTLEVER